jgi:hypothetical protein
VALDLAHRHAAGVEAENLVVETVEARLPLDLAISCGSKLPLRSRGTAISISPSSVRIVFELDYGTGDTCVARTETAFLSRVCATMYSPSAAHNHAVVDGHLWATL